MKTSSRIVAAIAMTGFFGVAMLAQNGNDLFQQGLVKERTQGDFAGAVKIYQSIVQKYSGDRKLVAKALFQMGQAYEKLGNAEARKTYERIAREFNDQKDVAADANRRLAAISLPATVDAGPRTISGGDDIDSEASISPDGRWMAMTAWGSGAGDLAVRDMSNGQLKRLQIGECKKPSRNCAFAELPVFSPDMKWIAYTWYNDELDGRGQLRVIANEPGAKPRTIARNLEFDGIWATAWSADGKSILVDIRRHEEKTWQVGWISVSDGSLRVLRSLDWRIIGGVKNFTLSPDGRYIAYSALPTNPKGQVSSSSPEAAERHIYLLAVDGTSDIDVVKTAASNQAPLWTPDGGHIVFTSTVSGKTDLWSVPVRNGNAAGSPWMLQRDVGDMNPIGITRAGAYYYVQSKEGVEQISIVEVNQNSEHRTADTFVGINPSWSPDGKSVAFARRTAAQGTFDLVVRSASTGEESVHRHSDLKGGPPRWFHNGSGLLQIYLPSSDVQSDRSWQLLDLKTGKFNEAIGFGGAPRSGVAVLSRDDRTLYMASQTPNPAGPPLGTIIGVDLNTNKERTVFTFPGSTPAQDSIALALNPAGDRFAIATRDAKTNEAHIALIRTDGSDYRELPLSFKAPNVNDKLHWTSDGRSIMFADNDSSAGRDWRIMRVGIDGGTPVFTGLTIKALSTFDLSPDDSRIVFSTLPNASRTQDLMVIENLTSRLKDSR